MANGDLNGIRVSRTSGSGSGSSSYKHCVHCSLFFDGTLGVDEHHSPWSLRYASFCCPETKAIHFGASKIFCTEKIGQILKHSCQN